MLSSNDVVALFIFPLLGFGLLWLAAFFLIKCKQMARVKEDAAAQESKEESIRHLKEAISNGLNLKKWVPDDPPLEPAEGDRDSPAPSGEAVKGPHSPAPTAKSFFPAACAMGSDDCEPLAWGEEMAGCAICLNHFKPEQLVCESNNPLCRHVFHKDCMVDWLMKKHDNCPMCREVYLLVKTVEGVATYI
jgi:hypothetical protein